MIQIFHPDGPVLFLDSTLTLHAAEGANVAIHPMDAKAPASDHVEPTPVTLTLECVISEHPTEAQEDRTTGLTSPEFGGGTTVVLDALAGLTGPQRVTAARDFLRSMVGEFVEIISSRFVYEDCLLTSWPHSWDIKRSVPFTLTFVVVRRVEVRTARIPARANVPSSVTDPEDEGAQGTDDPNAENTAFTVALTEEILPATLEVLRSFGF